MPLRQFNFPSGASDPAFHRAVPLYYRLSLLLRERIRSGVWATEAPIPGEPQLCREFHVSRGTVAQAIALLVQEGILVRQRGRGTFVARREPISGMAKLDGPVGDYLYQGLSVKIARVSKRLVVPPPPVATFFGLEPGGRLARFLRLRTSGGVPLSYAINYLPRTIGDRITLPVLRRQSMLRTLENDLGLKLGPIRQSIEVVVADLDITRALGVPFSSPTLLIQMEIHTHEGEPVSLGQTFFRADRYRYTVEFRRVDSLEDKGRSTAQAQLQPAGGVSWAGKQRLGTG